MIKYDFLRLFCNFTRQFMKMLVLTNCRSPRTEKREEFDFKNCSQFSPINQNFQKYSENQQRQQQRQQHFNQYSTPHNTFANYALVRELEKPQAKVCWLEQQVKSVIFTLPTKCFEQFLFQVFPLGRYQFTRFYKI